MIVSKNIMAENIMAEKYKHIVDSLSSIKYFEGVEKLIAIARKSDPEIAEAGIIIFQQWYHNSTSATEN